MVTSLRSGGRPASLSAFAFIVVGVFIHELDEVAARSRQRLHAPDRIAVPMFPIANSHPATIAESQPTRLVLRRPRQPCARSGERAGRELASKADRAEPLWSSGSFATVDWK